MSSRYWSFVCNNYTDEQVAAAKALEQHGATCVMFGKEVGEKCGTPHLQGAVAFKEVKSGRQLQKMLPGFDHRPKYKDSTFASLFDYTRKGEQSKAEWDEHGIAGPSYGRNADVYVFGTRPIDAKEKGENEKQRCKRNLEAIVDGRIEDVDIDVIANSLQRYEYGAAALKRARNKPVPLPGPRGTMNEFHYSRTPGTGKTKYTQLANPGCYEHQQTDKFWLNYDYQKVVLFQDLGEKFAVANAANFKRWFDLAPFSARIMYGAIDARPQRMIITSNYTPEELWGDVDGAAMRDRFRFYDWGTQPYLKSKEPPVRNPRWRLPEGLPPLPDEVSLPLHDPPSPSRCISTWDLEEH